MAFSATFNFSSLILLFIILLHLAEAHQTVVGVYETPAPTPLPDAIDCGVACEGRCKMSSRPRLCKRACGSCCADCKCVPPGTYGNLRSCPCYDNLTTRNQIHKCP
ncbi:unnamed protein product [Sphenostylis stenocarpa]|uniref:Uncharacterized protein n=1 Tax=Sphenostylis stenocarpa TaxID=92480 RepID=A0AA86SK64_9FABA|nr:unnamed protein product [Sphenostylis stenocarpa]